MPKMSKEELKAIRLKAENEFKKERSEEIVEKLKILFVKREKAMAVVKNIDHEIEDYEMQLTE